MSPSISPLATTWVCASPLRAGAGSSTVGCLVTTGVAGPGCGGGKLDVGCLGGVSKGSGVIGSSPVGRGVSIGDGCTGCAGWAGRGATSIGLRLLAIAGAGDLVSLAGGTKAMAETTRHDTTITPAMARSLDMRNLRD